MEHAVDQCTELFISKLGEFANKGEVVDFGTWLFVTPHNALGSTKMKLN
jgi:hypothetical protein